MTGESGKNMTTNEFIEKLDSLFAKGQYDKVEPFMLAVLEEAKEREDYGLYLSVGNEMIGYYRSVSRFKKAYQISEDMLLLMEELQMDQSAEFATVLLNTATAYSFDENFEMALQFYRRTEQIYHQLVRPDDYLFAGLYNNMGSLMEKMGRNEEALSLLVKALGILQNYPDRQMEAATNFTNLGLLYLKTEDYESGKKCVLQAVSMFEALDTPASHYSAALSALGEICYHEKDYREAVVWYEKTLAEIEKHYGFNLAYAVVCENLSHVYREAGKPEKAEECLDKAVKVRGNLKQDNAVCCGQDASQSGKDAGTEQTEAAGKEKMENGPDIKKGALAGCRAYYEKYGKPLLAQFPELQGHFAAGLVGEGSECFGYDDTISSDHDYFPRFFIWLDDWAYEKYGEALTAAYKKLPVGSDTIMTPEAAQRCGVCKTTDFYYRLTGRENPPENLYDWVSVQETRLAAATNGEVFEDCGGGFTAQREAYLAYFPEDVRKKKLAARLRKMAQTGQYQYGRCMRRGEYVAAQLALAEFIQNTGSCCFLLAREYMPYFKWMHRKLREIPGFFGVAERLEKLTLLSSQHDKWDLEKPGNYGFSLNTADEKVVLIEEIADLVIRELKKQGLADGQDSYLEPYGLQVENRIEDEVLRAANLV